MDADSHTQPDETTVAEDRTEATAAHDADRPPTPEEERAAESFSPDPTVAEHHKEAIERGAAVEGEGQVEG